MIGCPACHSAGDVTVGCAQNAGKRNEQDDFFSHSLTPPSFSRTRIPNNSLSVTTKIYQNHNTPLHSCTKSFIIYLIDSPRILAMFFPTGLVAIILDLISGYALKQSFTSISNIKKYEKNAEKAADWSDTAKTRLWDTRYTIGAGFVSVSLFACCFFKMSVNVKFSDQRSALCHSFLAFPTLFLSLPVVTSSLRPGDRFGQQSWPLPYGSARRDIWRTSGLPRLVCPFLTSTMPRSSRAWRLSDSWMFSRSGGE